MFFCVLCNFISWKSLNLFWNSKLLYWAFSPSHLFCGMLSWFIGMLFCSLFFFFSFFLITFVWNLTSVLLCFIFMWKNSFLELLGGRTYDGFFFKFIELSLLLSCSPQCGSLLSDTSCLCSPHLLLPGSVLSFVSIPPILFDFDPLPAVFPPGEEAWDQSWKFAEISCFSPFRSTALAPADLAVPYSLTLGSGKSPSWV